MATSIGLVNPTTTQDINCRCINSKSNCFRSKMCNATDKKVEYLKSVKGHFFGIDFDESAIYTDTTDAWDEDELFAGVGGWSGRERGSSKEEDTDDTLILV